MPRAEALRIEGLTVRYGSKVAVEDLTLEVRSGEVFGFLGPNGAGKTSAIRALLGLVKPASGRIEVLGEERVAEEGDLRARLGFLPGDLALFPFQSGRECLEFFAGLQDCSADRREEVLERLGFPMDAYDRPSSSYSTGMRQMIGATAALQHDPELMILDEPTTGLDPIVRRALLRILRERVDEGRTVLFSSHVLSEVEDCADRVALLREGRLVLCEPIAELRGRFPSVVRFHRRDGSREEFEFEGEISALLERLRHEDLLDLEVRPPDLARLFDRLGEEGQS